MTTTELAGGAPLDQPAPPAPMFRPCPPRLRGERATEKHCQQTIVDAARLLGYRVLAIRTADGGKRGGGWASPIQGDAGYPDVTLAHPVAGVVFAELKRYPNRVEPSQAAWGRALLDAGAHWRLVWVPEELDDFVQQLADWSRP